MLLRPEEDGEKKKCPSTRHTYCYLESEEDNTAYLTGELKCSAFCDEVVYHFQTLIPTAAALFTPV